MYLSFPIKRKQTISVLRQSKQNSLKKILRTFKWATKYECLKCSSKIKPIPYVAEMTFLIFIHFVISYQLSRYCNELLQ